MEPINPDPEGHRKQTVDSLQVDAVKALNDSLAALKLADERLLAWHAQKCPPPEHRVDLTQFRKYLGKLVVAVEREQFDEAANLTRGFPASLLAKRMHEKKRLLAPALKALGGASTSARQAEASRSNGRLRRALPGAWKPRELPDIGAADGSSWHQRQAHVLLEEVVREVQSGVTPPANLDALIEHRVSIRIEREVSRLLQTPAFAIARQALPSRWGPVSYSQLRFIHSKVRHLVRRIKDAVDPGADYMIRSVPIGGGKIANLGPLSNREDTRWSIDAVHLVNNEIFVKQLNRDADYIPVFRLLNPVMRQIRKEASRIYGFRTIVRVKVGWRGTNKVVEYGPFPARGIAIRWRHLHESEIYVRADAEPGEWHPLAIS